MTTFQTASGLRQRALQVSESRYRRLFETAQDGILLLNAGSAQIEDVNPYLIRMLGYSHAEFLGKKLWEVGAFANVARSKEMFLKLQTDGFVRYDNLPLRSKTGKPVDVEFVSNSYDCEGVKVIQCNIRDITARVAAEAHASLRTRLYSALSECNKAIVHCASAEELFPRVCQIAVDRAGMKMAWIGLVNAQSYGVRAVASFGDDAGFLKEADISVTGSGPAGGGPTGTAIRTDRPIWSEDFATDPAWEPWRTRRARFDLKVSGTLPLHNGADVVGALTVYSTDAIAFDEFTRDLLLEMAADISFALAGFDREAQRKEAEAAVVKSEAQLNYVERMSNTGGFRVNLQNHTSHRTLEHDRIFGYHARLNHWTLETFMGHVIPEDRAEVEARIKTLQAGQVTVDYECRIRRPDGDLRWIRTVAEQERDPAGNTRQVFGIVQDITERKKAAQELYESAMALQESRDHLLLATGSANIGIWDWDVSSTHLVWDACMYRLYGIRSSDFRGARSAWQAGLHPDDRARGDVAIAAALEGSKEFAIEFRVVWPNGELRHIEGYAVVQRAADGAARRMIGVNWDITERKRAEERISYLNRVFGVLSGINSLIVRVSDRGKLFTEACRIAVNIGGLRLSLIGILAPGSTNIEIVASAAEDAELLGAVKADWASPGGACDALVAAAIRSRAPVVVNDLQADTRVDLGNRYAGHRVRSIAVLPLIVADKAVGAVALYASEVDFFHAEELKLLIELAGDIAFAIVHLEQQERLEYFAYFDELTELPNRTQFIERVTRKMPTAVADGRRLAALIIDLKRFRNINESLGREAGDSILRQVAQWLTKAVGDPSLLARVGPDQFALLLSVKDGQEGGQYAVKMVEAFLQNPFHLNDAVFRISARIGVALFPEDGTDADTLVRHADAALKIAKVRGVSYLLYTRKMTGARAGRLRLETQLLEAHEKKEFVLHYQPKINLATGQVTGAEALMRWNNPRKGLVPPGEFIPILEETGLIYEVGRWALRTAVADYLHWRAAGLAAVPVAVNVSSLQRRDPGFITEIRRAIGVDADAVAGLELEIRESLIMEDIRHGIALLNSIRALGVRIAIDDFGTGLSSLSYLAKLRVDTLKIARSLVTDLTASPEGWSLASTIVTLAHGMKLKVVAEGVETKEQARQLGLLQCDEIQGFLLSKALPRQQFEAQFLAGSTVATHRPGNTA